MAGQLVGALGLRGTNVLHVGGGKPLDQGVRLVEVCQGRFDFLDCGWNRKPKTGV